MFQGEETKKVEPKQLVFVPGIYSSKVTRHKNTYNNINNARKLTFGSKIIFSETMIISGKFYVDPENMSA